MLHRSLKRSTLRHDENFIHGLERKRVPPHPASRCQKFSIQSRLRHRQLGLRFSPCQQSSLSILFLRAGHSKELPQWRLHLSLVLDWSSQPDISQGRRVEWLHAVGREDRRPISLVLLSLIFRGGGVVSLKPASARLTALTSVEQVRHGMSK